MPLPSHPASERSQGPRDTFLRNTFFDIPEDDADLPEGPATCPPASDGWWPSSSSSRLGSDTLNESSVWLFFLPLFGEISPEVLRGGATNSLQGFAFRRNSLLASGATKEKWRQKVYPQARCTIAFRGQVWGDWYVQTAENGLCFFLIQL